MTDSLNQGQRDAAEAFFAFLFSDEKEFIISGRAGTGKSYLMSYLIDKIMPRYFEMCGLLGIEPNYEQVVLTATTNKAAEVLAEATHRATSTIHSFLNLRVMEDYATGTSKLKRTDAWKVHEKHIVQVDECSMIDTPLRNTLLEGTHNSKIVYVGDHCQLAPVTETISPVYRTNAPFFELTEQMRTGVAEINQLHDQLRHTVETGEFFPIETVPGIIDWLDDEQMEQTIQDVFLAPERSSRILAYTNRRVNEFNDHIRGLRNLPNHYTVGESLVSASATTIRKESISVEEELSIVAMADRSTMIPIDHDVQLEVCYSTLSRKRGGYIEKVPVPVDREHYNALIKYYSRVKNWGAYFKLKRDFPDLRPIDSSTIHKSQGSTYDSVFVDLGNISTCHNADQVARMLYVAMSRAKHRIYLYGNLADKYGGVIHKGI